ncbi:MAG: glucosyl transferase [Ignavibacteriaceae bacterium]|nr:glucosyl transferase [Ignavibacteriaceae bacterium]
MKKQLLFIVLISFALLNFNCKKTLTGPDSPFTLSVEDVSCTEAWVKITSANFQNPSLLTLFVDDKPNQNLTLVSSDTVLCVDSLLPNQSYKIKAVFAANNQQQTTNEVIAKTMDTTTHNFTWQTFTFGEHSSSTLYDVAIIDENNIWAVGEIYMKDSLGNTDPHAFNAVHWDGNTWELKRIMFYTICGQTSLTAYPAKSIYAFSEKDIWIAMDGDQVARINGTSQISTQCSPWSFSINKIWGTSSSDLYAVGNGGNIAHYNGTSWKKIESGTTSIINDVWGIEDKVGNSILYCPVSSFFEPGDKKILRITNNKVDSFLWNKDVRLYSAWTAKENFLFVCGEGAFENKFGYWNQITLPAVGMNSVRGNNINDIFIIGDYGFISHFNGVNWKVMSSPNDKGYSKVNVKEDVVVICGQNQGRGIIEIGKRN